MKQLILDQLIIEVTRKCNLQCDHCLRGCSENLDINTDYIDVLLENVTNISSITFTGGEPFLNPQAIEYFIDKCIELHIEVGSFYIATNATQYSDKIMSVLLKLWCFCSENECSGIDISNDEYHDIDFDVVEKLKAFRFCNDKYEEKPHYKPSIIDEGNAYEHGIGERIVEPEELEFDVYNNEIAVRNIVYLNAKGNIIKGCDFSFNRQDNDNDVFLCHVNNFYQTIKNESLTLI